MGNNASSTTTATTNNGNDSGTATATENDNRQTPPLQQLLQQQSTLRTLFRPGTNALGLTKGELDERCRPSGLYPTCQWEDKMIRRLIGDGKLASRSQGTEERNSCTDSECPICFLNHPEINVTKCCQANICTECYLQIKPQKPQAQKQNGKPQHNNCPFCNASRLLVTVAGKLDPCTVEDKVKEEQQLEAARARHDGSKPAGIEQPEENPNGLVSSSGFGSSLEHNPRVALMRARSSSIASEHSASRGGSSHNNNNNSNSSPSVQEQIIAHAAMTPEERHAIEDEMRAQHHHPLTLRLEQEEAERRMRNDMAYYQRSTRRTIRDVRSSVATTGRPHSFLHGGSAGAAPAMTASRDWNSSGSSTSSRGILGGSGNAGRRFRDDNAVLEAAVMLSLEEQARRVGSVPPLPDNNARTTGATMHDATATPFPLTTASPPCDNGGEGGLLPHGVRPAIRGLSEEQQIALAIEASLREASTTTSSTARPV